MRRLGRRPASIKRSRLRRDNPTILAAVVILTAMGEGVFGGSVCGILMVNRRNAARGSANKYECHKFKNWSIMVCMAHSSDPKRTISLLDPGAFSPGSFGDPARAVTLLNGAPWDHRETVLFLPHEIMRVQNATKWDKRGLAFLADQAQPKSADSARTKFEDQAASKLRGFVDGWLAAGRDWQRWVEGNFAVWQAANAELSRWTFVLGADTGGMREAPLIPYLQAKMALGASADLVQGFAIWYLLGVLLGGDGARVGRCDRCRKYFYSQSRRGNKRYCSRSCNRVAGATRATRLQRAAERRRKLEAARSALKRLPPRRRTSWKQFVVAAAGRSGTILTPNFLTRAVSLGELVAPRT